MLAIASLATGFVVAAITPSHGLGDELGHPDADKTLSDLDRTIADDSPAVDDKAPGRNG